MRTRAYLWRIMRRMVVADGWRVGLRYPRHLKFCRKLLRTCGELSEYSRPGEQFRIVWRFRKLYFTSENNHYVNRCWPDAKRLQRIRQKRLGGVIQCRRPCS